MRNKILALFLACLLLMALPITVLALEPDFGRLGSIRVALTEKTGDTPIVGAELSIYHVATVALNASGNLSYTFTPAFADCGAALDDPDLGDKLEQFLSAHAPEGRRAVTDSDGVATCSDLPLGLYFLRQTNAVDGFAPCKSFLVTVPLLSDGEYHYDVEATPKTEVARRISITIKKLWNADETSKLPEEVTVQLLQNGTVIETATLNAQNQWQVTFPDLPERDDYSVQERDIPQGFTVTYDQHGYTFIVTNTAALIQTGPRTWPIPVLAILGVALLAAGALLLGKKRR